MIDNERIQHATLKAQEAFWAEIAKAFPEAQSGDVSPDTQLNFDAACISAVEDWVASNMPEAMDENHVPSE